MNFDLHTAEQRAILSRIRLLRKQRQVRQAQSLWDWAIARPSGFGQKDVLQCSPAAALYVNVEIEGVYLLLRQDNDTRYAEAQKILDELRRRLLSGRPPLLLGERRDSAIASLASALSLSGREADARKAEAERLPGLGDNADESRLRSLTRGMSNVRAADTLGNCAIRDIRLAYIEALGTDPTHKREARRLLDRARLFVRVSGTRRISTHGRLIVRVQEARLMLCEAMLEDPDKRADILSRLAVDTKRIVLESMETPEVFPASMLIRQGLYGEVIAELARCVPTDQRRPLARLARVCMAPRYAVNEVEADYIPSLSIRYGDACALSGDERRARSVWRQMRGRMVRSRGETSAIIHALDVRIERGVPVAPEPG